MIFFRFEASYSLIGVARHMSARHDTRASVPTVNRLQQLFHADAQVQWTVATTRSNLTAFVQLAWCTQIIDFCWQAAEHLCFEHLASADVVPGESPIVRGGRHCFVEMVKVHRLSSFGAIVVRHYFCVIQFIRQRVSQCVATSESTLLGMAQPAWPIGSKLRRCYRWEQRVQE